MTPDSASNQSSLPEQLNKKIISHQQILLKPLLSVLQMVDADVFLTNKDTLKDLVKKQLPVVAPMLISDGIYSNFWLDSGF